MKIPKRFKLMGQTIDVIFEKDLIDNNDNRGEARYRRNEIALQPSVMDAVIRPPAQIGQSFCHELVHWILFLLSEDKLRKDEQFVDRFSGLLHQSLTTMEYEHSDHDNQ